MIHVFRFKIFPKLVCKFITRIGENGDACKKNGRTMK